MASDRASRGRERPGETGRYTAGRTGSRPVCVHCAGPGASPRPATTSGCQAHLVLPRPSVRTSSTDQLELPPATTHSSAAGSHGPSQGQADLSGHHKIQIPDYPLWSYRERPMTVLTLVVGVGVSVGVGAGVGAGAGAGAGAGGRQPSIPRGREKAGSAARRPACDTRQCAPPAAVRISPGGAGPGRFPTRPGGVPATSRQLPAAPGGSRRLPARR